MVAHVAAAQSCLTLLMLAAPSVEAQKSAPKAVVLPAPQMEGGQPLMQVLKNRRTARAFKPDPLPTQTLSNLLWAAAGINRPGTGQRTAPTARNWQEIDVYVALPEALYRYEPKVHQLLPVVPADLRAATGTQPFVKDAPLALVLVADIQRMEKASEQDRDLYAATDAAYVSQNIYLFCSSEGLATGARGSIDRPALAKLMNLKPSQRIILAHSVGFPVP